MAGRDFFLNSFGIESEMPSGEWLVVRDAHKEIERDWSARVRSGDGMRGKSYVCTHGKRERKR
eukprot:27075-Amorphochlora_amoeboformis.AAC.3